MPVTNTCNNINIFTIFPSKKYRNAIIVIVGYVDEYTRTLSTAQPFFSIDLEARM